MSQESKAVRELRQCVCYMSKYEESRVNAVLSELAAAKLDIVAITNQRNAAQTETVKLQNTLAAVTAERDAFDQLLKDAQARTVESSKLITELIAERNAAQSAAAEMRAALETFYPKRGYSSAELKKVEELRKHALSLDCGSGHVPVSELEPILDNLRYAGHGSQSGHIGCLPCTVLNQLESLNHEK